MDKIVNKSEKSFNNYTGPEDGVFSKINYFYGTNGSGKSSLAKLLYKQAEEESGQESVALFNNDYIKDTVVFEDDLLIGVKVTFDKKALSTKSEIDELKNNIILLNYEKKATELSALEKSLTEYIKLTYNSIKIEKGLTNKIPTYSSFEDLNGTLTKKLSDALKKHTDETISNVTGSKDIEEKLQILQSYNIPNLNIIDLGTLSDLSDILSTNFLPLMVDKNILDWLSDGIKLHNDGTCHFCGNSFDFENKITEINDLLRNITAKKISEIRIIHDIIIESQRMLNNYNIDCKELLNNDNFGKKYVEFKSACANISLKFSDIITLIETKLMDMNTIYKYDFIQLEEDMTKLLHFHMNLIYEKDIYLKTLESNLKGISLIQHGYCAKKMLENELYNDKYNQYIDLFADVTETQKLHEIYSNKIKELSLKSSDINDFREYLNHLLKIQLINIELSISNENYYLKMPNSDVRLRVSDISEGERNILAFIYFYTNLVSERKNNKYLLNSDINYIIIDDPITSLDSNNNSLIHNLISNIIQEYKNKANVKVFILTHDWREYSNLIYGVKTNGSNPLSSLWSITKVNGESVIKKLSKNYTSYGYMYVKLNELSEKKVWDVDDSIMASNLCRRVIETYIRFNYGKAKPATFGIKDFMIDHFCTENSEKDRIKMEKLLKVINIYSHGDYHDYDQYSNAVDIKSSISDFISLMKKSVIHKHHHQAMLETDI